jgi:hypothetical protein
VSCNSVMTSPDFQTMRMRAIVRVIAGAAARGPVRA